MGKKILVAGCGLGGLSAAAAFAKAGYEVTILEQNNAEDLGFDWHDSLRRNTFEKADIPMPDESRFSPSDTMSYFNPKKTVRLVPDKKASPNIVYVDRKFLIQYLMEYAQTCGVEIRYGVRVKAPICESQKVCGLCVTENGTQQELYGDLVIDACGVDSPVRRGLPVSFGIQKEIAPENLFCVWRGYFNKTEEKFETPNSTIFFYHCGVPGMDWAITKPGYIDILIGGFGAQTSENVERAIADFHETFPYMGDEVIRGGRYEKLPLGKTLPLLVANGYAAVGNSACMTEPLSGSGMDMSIVGGKILADAVLEQKGDTSVKTLWNYNYRYFKTFAQRHYNDAIIKGFLAKLTAEDIDFFMEKKILTAKEIAGGGREKYTVSQILEKVHILKKPGLLFSLLSVVGKLNTAGKLKKSIPEVYDPKAVAAWLELYKKLS